MAQLIRNMEAGGSYADLYTTYGIQLVKGAYDALIKYPAVKDLVSNNSRLEDGVRYIAKEQYTKFNEKNFSIRFVMEEGTSESAFYARLESFLALIGKGMFELKITTLNRVFRLVYRDCDRMSTFKSKHAIFELKLTEPDPTDRGEQTTHQTVANASV